MTRDAVDAIVIGGGIVGVCTALQLQRTGRSVMVVERGVPGDQASGHNAGIFTGDCVPTGLPSVIRSLPKLLRDPDSALVLRKRYLPRLAPWLVRFALSSRTSEVERIAKALVDLSSRGAEAYRPLIAGTPAEDIYRNRGTLNVFEQRSSLDPNALPFRLRAKHGIAFEILDGRPLAERSPLLRGRFGAGVWYPTRHWTTDPRTLSQTLLADVVSRSGATLRAAVTRIETSAGRAHLVRTTDGDLVAGAVVIAAGPWSRILLRQLGSDVPLDVERGYGADLPDPGVRLDFPISSADHHFVMTPHRTGIRIAGIDELASVSAPPDLRLAERVLRTAKRVFPELRTDNATLWMGSRPSLPDSLPVIGRAPRVANVYLAFGHGHKGLGTGAITGKLVQELMDGQPTTIDIAPYSPTRFSLTRALFN